MPFDRQNKISCNHFREPFEVTLELLNGKWKALLLWKLRDKNVIRYNEFLREIPGISQKMLSQQLKDLENNGLVARKVLPEVPPIVEYSLLEEGERLISILEAMNQWGEEYIRYFEALQ